MRRALVLLLVLILPGPLRAEPVTVFAAASLKPVLDRVLDDSPVDTRAVYAGSSALARQIEAGAPADVFVSANPGWMDHLEEVGAIDASSRRDIARNRLVLVGQAGARPLSASELPHLAGTRIATALTDAVPAGLYARAALEHLGLWEALAPGVVEAQDVRAALRLATTGAVPHAIVYATDAASTPDVTVRFVFPDRSHQPIVYPAALTVRASPRALIILDHITNAREAFAQAGFLPPDMP